MVKIGRYLSIVSIAVALLFILLKLQFDIATYQTMKDLISKGNGDISPTIAAGGIKIVILYASPVLLSLIMSIIGIKRKNNYSWLALSISIFAVIYLIIPVGMLIAII